MTEPAERGSPAEQHSPWVVLTMLAMVGIPAGLTLSTVDFPGTLQVVSPDPTPRGYTVSLLMFVAPILVIFAWFIARKDLRIPKRAFWTTLGILVPLGFGLDFFFANYFFLFPNPGATLRIGAPALGGPVPVEEYLFYLTGFMAVLLIYVWLDEFWLFAYNRRDYAVEGRKITRLIRFHWESLLVAVVLIAVAVVHKKVLSGSPQGFPGYFTFLTALAFVPSAGLFASARPFINWRAFSLTLFLIVLISLVWEATLAIPYGWWGYQPGQMMGVFVETWAHLPIEAVCVWIAVSYATVIVYEILKLWLASGRAARECFCGF